MINSCNNVWLNRNNCSVWVTDDASYFRKAENYIEATFPSSVHIIDGGHSIDHIFDKLLSDPMVDSLNKLFRCKTEFWKNSKIRARDFLLFLDENAHLKPKKTNLEKKNPYFQITLWNVPPKRSTTRWESVVSVIYWHAKMTHQLFKFFNSHTQYLSKIEYQFTHANKSYCEFLAVFYMYIQIIYSSYFFFSRT